MIITISRQAATNGALVAHLVAERLGLRVYDSELVDEIARQLNVDPSILTRFDEARLSPVSSILWEWRSSINEQVYHRSLVLALRRIAQAGNAVIIGRGANFVLRGPDNLHVRIVAPHELRVAMYRAGEGVDEHTAEQWIRREDRERAKFVEAQFHHHIDDPQQYDLVVNLAGLTPEMAAEVIARAAILRAEVKLAPDVKATLPRYVEILARHRRPTRPSI